mmetsp:Transcript_200/g.507  ORF Transcript_200/g.507 Transcript_200/m.507 type:complete len:206 (+) Transcript_200:191-808(+)
MLRWMPPSPVPDTSERFRPPGTDRPERVRWMSLLPGPDRPEKFRPISSGRSGGRSPCPCPAPSGEKKKRPEPLCRGVWASSCGSTRSGGGGDSSGCSGRGRCCTTSPFRKYRNEASSVAVPSELGSRRDCTEERAEEKESRLLFLRRSRSKRDGLDPPRVETEGTARSVLVPPPQVPRPTAVRDSTPPIRGTSRDTSPARRAGSS